MDDAETLATFGYTRHRMKTGIAIYKAYIL
jgi:hypothetical protein